MRNPAQTLCLATLLLAAACTRSNTPTGNESTAAAAVEEHTPAMAQPNPAVSLPLCLLPAGTIGLPDPVSNPLPLPDGGNGLEEGANTDAPPYLPATVALRNDRQTFNRRYEFVLDKGLIWYRSHAEITGIHQPWARLAMPACLAGTVIGISVDDNELIALRTDGSIYGMDSALKDPLLFNWSTRWGPPVWLGSGHRVPADYLGWSWSVISQGEDKNWTDPAGNLHAIGAGKVSHIWLLRDGGQRFTFVDPWLPKDESFEMCGPHRGRFRAVNLCASGSTIITINRYGDIYTRHYDFDLAGDDPLFFQYSYDDQRGVNNPAIQLPSFGWVNQPKVPGRITRNISVHKQGENMISRILRVEGMDAAGHTGYWQRDVADAPSAPWQFTATNEPLSSALLDNTAQDSSARTLGESEDLTYARNLAALPQLATREHVTGDADWAGELLDFNVYCSPARFKVTVAPGQSFELLLHSTDVIRQTARARGLDDNPRSFSGVIEIPQVLYNTLDQQPAKVREFIQLYLAGQRFTPVKLSGITGKITVQDFNWDFTTR